MNIKLNQGYTNYITARCSRRPCRWGVQIVVDEQAIRSGGRVREARVGEDPADALIGATVPETPVT
jgi:hypothetical protein